MKKSRSFFIKIQILWFSLFPKFNDFSIQLLVDLLLISMEVINKTTNYIFYIYFVITMSFPNGSQAYYENYFLKFSSKPDKKNDETNSNLTFSDENEKKTKKNKKNSQKPKIVQIKKLSLILLLPHYSKSIPLIN